LPSRFPEVLRIHRPYYEDEHYSGKTGLHDNVLALMGHQRTASVLIASLLDILALQCAK
jgi:hypothetical protein